MKQTLIGLVLLALVGCGANGAPVNDGLAHSYQIQVGGNAPDAHQAIGEIQIRQGDQPMSVPVDIAPGRPGLVSIAPEGCSESIRLCAILSDTDGMGPYAICEQSLAQCGAESICSVTVRQVNVSPPERSVDMTCH